MGDLNDILHGLEPSLGPVGGEPCPLEGGITNRNFRVSFGAAEYVVRLHGKDTTLLGISREAERLANEEAARLHIAPRVAGVFEGGMVTRYVACAPLARDELAARVEEVARALRAFHDSGVRLPARFCVPQLLSDYARIVAQRGGSTTGDYEQAQEIASRIAAALPAPETCPCHNDLLPGNLIRELNQDRIMIVDWEYAGMGHPCFDLGNLSVNNELDEATDERLLYAYHGAAPSPRQRATLKLMRVLSDVREAAWGAMQSRVSDLDFDFEGYARRHFQRMRAAAASAQFDEWLAEA
ncbi:MAG: phosphotransferase [Solirubrobacteraceae bacterium]